MTANKTFSLPLPPGSLGLPFIGESIAFFNDLDFIDKRQKKYGSTFKTNIFARPTIVMSGAEANRFLFSNENKYFSATWPASTKILLGKNSLSVIGGAIHTQRRKLMFQAFQPRALASYLPTIESITTTYLEKWNRVGTLTWYPELRNYTFDIAAKLFIGKDGGSQTVLGQLFEEWCNGLFTLPIRLPRTKFSKALRCRTLMLEEIEKIVLKRQKEKDLGEDALGILLQAKDEEENSLSLDELKDQVLLLLFAGHETLTSALVSFCLLMAQHKEIFDRIRTEQNQLGIDESLTTDKLKEMVYLEQVLKEVLRFIPAVGGGFRDVIEDCEFNGYSIPKGWVVQYAVGQTHQDEEVYQLPEKFDPDRFSPERGEDKNKVFSYIPFGGGARECLGKEFARLEMKLFAAMLARNYEWELLPEQDLRMSSSLTPPHPRDGLQVNFRKIGSS